MMHSVIINASLMLKSVYSSFAIDKTTCSPTLARFTERAKIHVNSTAKICNRTDELLNICAEMRQLMNNRLRL